MIKNKVFDLNNMLFDLQDLCDRSESIVKCLILRVMMPNTLCNKKGFRGDYFLFLKFISLVCVALKKYHVPTYTDLPILKLALK
jgi:hypothetical protein